MHDDDGLKNHCCSDSQWNRPTASRHTRIRKQSNKEENAGNGLTNPDDNKAVAAVTAAMAAAATVAAAAGDATGVRGLGEAKGREG